MVLPVAANFHDCDPPTLSRPPTSLCARRGFDMLRFEHIDDDPVLDHPTFGFEIQKGQI